MATKKCQKLNKQFLADTIALSTMTAATGALTAFTYLQCK